MCIHVHNGWIDNIVSVDGSYMLNETGLDSECVYLTNI